MPPVAPTLPVAPVGPVAPVLPVGPITALPDPDDGPPLQLFRKFA